MILSASIWAERRSRPSLSTKVVENSVEVRADTPRGDYDATIALIGHLVVELEKRAGGGAAHVGIGHPGWIVPTTGLVARANSTWINGRPFGHDVAAALARPCRFSNDANCLAVSEATDGAAAGKHVVFGVILGTGVGGGVIIDGRVIDGANGIGGEWGPNPLPWPRDDERPEPHLLRKIGLP